MEAKEAKMAQRGQVGLFLGKFLPLHVGHVGALFDAYAACDHLIVVVDENRTLHRELWPLGRYPDGAQRASWIRQLFEGLPHVTITLLEDNNYYADHDGDMSGFARDILSREVDYCGKSAPDLIFFSELHYKNVWHHMYPDAELIVQDAKREGFDISGSQVRRSPYRHWQSIAPVVWPSIALRVCLQGSKALAYSQLLSRAYAAPLWSPSEATAAISSSSSEMQSRIICCIGCPEDWEQVGGVDLVLSTDEPATSTILSLCRAINARLA